MLHQPVKSLPKGTPVVLKDTRSPSCYLSEIFKVLLPWHDADGEAGPADAAGWLFRVPVWVAAGFGSTSNSSLQHSDLMWRTSAGDR